MPITQTQYNSCFKPNNLWLEQDFLRYQEVSSREGIKDLADAVLIFNSVQTDRMDEKSCDILLAELKDKKEKAFKLKNTVRNNPEESVNLLTLVESIDKISTSFQQKKELFQSADNIRIVVDKAINEEKETAKSKINFARDALIGGCIGAIIGGIVFPPAATYFGGSVTFWSVVATGAGVGFAGTHTVERLFDWYKNNGEEWSKYREESPLKATIISAITAACIGYGISFLVGQLSKVEFMDEIKKFASAFDLKIDIPQENLDKITKAVEYFKEHPAVCAIWTGSAATLIENATRIKGIHTKAKESAKGIKEAYEALQGLAIVHSAFSLRCVIL